MGLYIRKSVRAGPFRFNLSKSGVGVSVGVPGFRVGTGPRGNYVHAGRGGVYYRATLGGHRARAPRQMPPVRSVPATAPAPIADVLLSDVTGASAAELVPTGPGDLVDQLNAASRRHRIAQWLLVVLVVVILAKPLVGVVLLLPGVPAVIWLWLRDRAKHTVVVFYDVNDEVASWYEGLMAQIEALRGVSGLWRINAAGAVTTTHQLKVHGGASTIVSRASAQAGSTGPRVLATNIVVPTITCAKQAFSLLPDRVLIRDGKKFSDVAYTALQAQAVAHRFIEEGRVPRDAQQVDTTWKFVNVKGGPDRRFKNNRRLPVLLYGQLQLTSPQGLHWIIDISRATLADSLADAIMAAPRSLANTVDEPSPAEVANGEHINDGEPQPATRGDG